MKYIVYIDKKTNGTEGIYLYSSGIMNEKKYKKWMKENNMSDAYFAKMMDKANKHEISYDDINLILNKDKFAKKVASNQKKEGAEQIANVRQSATPQVSGTGSVDATEISVEDKIFDSLRNLDSQDNLFES